MERPLDTEALFFCEEPARIPSTILCFFGCFFLFFVQLKKPRCSFPDIPLHNMKITGVLVKYKINGQKL